MLVRYVGTGSTPACQPPPARGSHLSLKDFNGLRDLSNDRMVWKWRSSSDVAMSDFGDPLSISEWYLCILDTNGALPFQLGTITRAAGICPRGPCWTSTTSKYEYKDTVVASDGMFDLRLSPGTAGKGKIFASLRGLGLGQNVPALPLPAPAIVRLKRSDGPQCWEATFSTPSVDAAHAFIGRSD